MTFRDYAITLRLLFTSMLLFPMPVVPLLPMRARTAAIADVAARRIMISPFRTAP